MYWLCADSPQKRRKVASPFERAEAKMRARLHLLVLPLLYCCTVPTYLRAGLFPTKCQDGLACFPRSPVSSREAGERQINHQTGPEVGACSVRRCTEHNRRRERVGPGNPLAFLFFHLFPVALPCVCHPLLFLIWALGALSPCFDNLAYSYIAQVINLPLRRPWIGRVYRVPGLFPICCPPRPQIYLP